MKQLLLFLFGFSMLFGSSYETRLNFLEYLENTKKAEINLSEDSEININGMLDGIFTGVTLEDVYTSDFYKISQYTIEASDIIRKAYVLYLNKINKIVHDSYVVNETSIYEVMLKDDEVFNSILNAAAEETKVYLTKKLPQREYIREFTTVDLSFYIYAAFGAHLTEMAMPLVSRDLHYIGSGDWDGYYENIDSLKVELWYSVLEKFINILPGLDRVEIGWSIAKNLLDVVTEEVMIKPTLDAYWWQTKKKVNAFTPTRYRKLVEIIRISNEINKMEGGW